MFSVLYCAFKEAVALISIRYVNCSKSILFMVKMVSNLPVTNHGYQQC